MSLEKELDYDTMTPDILADFIFKVSGYKVDHTNIKTRIEHMINIECSKRSNDYKKLISKGICPECGANVDPKTGVSVS